MNTTGVVAKLVALQLEGSGGEVLNEVVGGWVVTGYMLEMSVILERSMAYEVHTLGRRSYG